MNQRDLIHRFKDGATKGTASNMFIRGNTIYSYGTHFPLAHRYDWGYLLNGDTYSVSTSRHQSECRRILQPNTVIPFSALQQALHVGRYNDYEEMNIEVLHQTEDTYKEIPYKDPKTGEDKIRYDHQLGSTLFGKDDRYFLSSVDAGAHWRQGFFLVELLYPAFTIQDAYDQMKTATLKDQPHVRQGEFFLVPKPDIKTNTLLKIENRPKWLYQIIETPAYNPDAYMRATKHAYERGTMRDNKTKWNQWWPTGITWDKPEDAWHNLYQRVYNKDGELMIGGSVHRVENPIRGESYDIAKFFEQRDHRNPHMGTYVRKDQSSNYYVRGTLRHSQHTALKLGKVWHQILHNRVKNSWSASGNID